MECSDNYLDIPKNAFWAQQQTDRWKKKKYNMYQYIHKLLPVSNIVDLTLETL